MDTFVVVIRNLRGSGNLDYVWAAVQQANMAKVDPATGKVLRRTDGKVLKPDGWKPPDIAAILEKVE